MVAQLNQIAHVAIATSVAGIRLIVAPALVVAPVVAVLQSVFGFGAGGIVAGSIAAGAQSAAGSLFAALTSLGAGGRSVAVLTAGVQGVGVGATVVAGAAAVMSARAEVEGSGETPDVDENPEGRIAGLS